MEPVLYEHKVQYYETDKMDCVHHSNYIRWFEEARTYLMDQGGFGYAQMEALGVMSPVLKAQAEYRTMARFGDTVVIDTCAGGYTGTRIAFTYICFLGPQGRPVSLKKACPAYHQKILEHLT